MFQAERRGILFAVPEPGMRGVVGGRWGETGDKEVLILQVLKAFVRCVDSTLKVMGMPF